MRIEHGDLWSYHQQGYWVVIPTNCQRRPDGTAVMGAGLALQAAKRYPCLSWTYGQELRRGGQYRLEPGDRLVLLPTKRHWKDPSDPELIRSGCQWLAGVAAHYSGHQFAVPLLGCGLGGLDWETQVRPILEEILTDDRFVVVIPKG
jgi:hypothetical protein